MVQSTRWTLSSVGLRILQMYAPYQPHVTEEIYQTLYKKSVGIESLHQTKFKNIQIKQSFPESLDVMEVLLSVVATVRKQKSEHALSLGTELASLEIFSQDKAKLNVVTQHEQLLKGATRAQLIKTNNTQLAKPELFTENNVNRLKISL